MVMKMLIECVAILDEISNSNKIRGNSTWDIGV